MGHLWQSYWFQSKICFGWFHTFNKGNAKMSEMAFQLWGLVTILSKRYERGDIIAYPDLDGYPGLPWGGSRETLQKKRNLINTCGKHSIRGFDSFLLRCTFQSFSIFAQMQIKSVHTVEWKLAFLSLECFIFGTIIGSLREISPFGREGCCERRLCWKHAHPWNKALHCKSLSRTFKMQHNLTNTKAGQQ